ncbi:hypothetical protein Pelo_14145 [Pelomyxa schiedti]|nr:hypothetical protein Pelo_14145 [Pelomyxa schiedti]
MTLAVLNPEFPRPAPWFPTISPGTRGPAPLAAQRPIDVRLSRGLEQRAQQRLSRPAWPGELHRERQPRAPIIPRARKSLPSSQFSEKLFVQLRELPLEQTAIPEFNPTFQELPPPANYVPLLEMVKTSLPENPGRCEMMHVHLFNETFLLLVGKLFSRDLLTGSILMCPAFYLKPTWIPLRQCGYPPLFVSPTAHNCPEHLVKGGFCGLSHSVSLHSLRTFSELANADGEDESQLPVSF